VVDRADHVTEVAAPRVRKHVALQGGFALVADLPVLEQRAHAEGHAQHRPAGKRETRTDRLMHGHAEPPWRVRRMFQPLVVVNNFR
jgi:hypothetical protein